MGESLNQQRRVGARVQHEAGEQTAMTVDEMIASIKGVAENASDMSRAATDASSSITEMAASVEQTAQNASGLSAAADDTASAIVQTLASIRQVSENTDALSSAAEQTSSSISEMSATVKAVEQKALESARLAEKVAKSASEQGMAAAREAMAGMENIRSTVEATAETVNRLGKGSQEIGQILKVIDEVTDQTSLLALNAAILTHEQWSALAEICWRYTPSAPLQLTTRQDIEFHNVSAEVIPLLQADLAHYGLSGIGACGDTLRNITVCPGSGLCDKTPDLIPLAFTLRNALERYQGIYSLPRKFKISLSACSKACAQPWIND